MTLPFYISRKSADIKGSHLVIACTSIGQSAVIAGGLFIDNQHAISIGYLSPFTMKPEVLIEDRSTKPYTSPFLILPNEVYYVESYKITILVLRAEILEGQNAGFENVISNFIASNSFVDILILGATRASASDLRESNKHIPEFYSTYNCAARSYAESLNKKQRIFHLRELYQSNSEKEDAESLCLAGQTPTLIKLASTFETPTYTLLIHAFDGLDLVGGWIMFSKVLDIMNIQYPILIQKRLELISLGEENTLPVDKLYEDISYPKFWQPYILN